MRRMVLLALLPLIVNAETELTYKKEVWAHIPEHRVCTNFNAEESSTCCYSWKVVEETKVEGVECDTDHNEDGSRKITYEYDGCGNVIGTDAVPEWCDYTISRAGIFDLETDERVGDYYYFTE